MSKEAFLAETSINGNAITAHDSASIANLFAKEKDELTKSLAEREEKIDELRLKIYRLENEVSSLKNEAATAAPKTRKTSKVGDVMSTVYKKEGAGKKPPRKKTVRKKKGKRSSVVSKASISDSDVESIYSGISGISNGGSSCESCTSMKEAAGRFPKIRLTTFLNCRERFSEADVNKDGTIDNEELSKILESSGLFFTGSQIQDILSKLDTDNSIALDFLEVLQVVTTLEDNPNRRSDLPKSLKDSQSKVCAVM